MKLNKKFLLATTLFILPFTTIHAVENDDDINTSITADSNNNVQEDTQVSEDNSTSTKSTKALPSNNRFVNNGKTYYYKAVDSSNTSFFFTRIDTTTNDMNDISTYTYNTSKKNQGISKDDLEKIYENKLSISSEHLSYSSIAKKDTFFKNSNGTYNERRIYSYTNGINTQYIRYYGGKNLKTNTLVYNKTYVITKNAKKQTTSIANYVRSQVWNEKYANVRTSYYKFSYHSNGRVKQKNTYLKSAKYNRSTSNKYEAFRSNGKRYQTAFNRYGSSKKISAKYKFFYNKAGQLKSNKYGKAYRYTYKYNSKGKKISTAKYKYNAKGKAQKIR